MQVVDIIASCLCKWLYYRYLSLLPVMPSSTRCSLKDQRFLHICFKNAYSFIFKWIKFTPVFKQKELVVETGSNPPKLKVHWAFFFCSCLFCFRRRREKKAKRKKEKTKKKKRFNLQKLTALHLEVSERCKSRAVPWEKESCEKLWWRLGMPLWTRCTPQCLAAWGEQGGDGNGHCRQPCEHQAKAR